MFVPLAEGFSKPNQTLTPTLYVSNEGDLHVLSAAGGSMTRLTAANRLRGVADAHAVLALAVLGVAAGAGVSGLVAYRRRRAASRLLGHLLTLAQTLLIAQVAIGLLLLSDERRSADDLHYAYGTLALVAVLAPWLYAPREPRRRLLWFSGATLLAAALATRAYLTGG